MNSPMLCRILCRGDSRRRVRTPECDGRRAPTCDEMAEGVPEWFTVELRGYRKTFISREGERFETVCALKKWRESHVCMDDPPYF